MWHNWCLKSRLLMVCAWWNSNQTSTCTALARSSPFTILHYHNLDKWIICLLLVNPLNGYWLSAVSDLILSLSVKLSHLGIPFFRWQNFSSLCSSGLVSVPKPISCHWGCSCTTILIAVSFMNTVRQDKSISLDLRGLIPIPSMKGFRGHDPMNYMPQLAAKV